MEQYKKICTGEDCYEMVDESDIERDSDWNIYERSKKCWNCRTAQDRKAIKKWRQHHKK